MDQEYRGETQHEIALNVVWITCVLGFLTSSECVVEPKTGWFDCLGVDKWFLTREKHASKTRTTTCFRRTLLHYKNTQVRSPNTRLKVWCWALSNESTVDLETNSSAPAIFYINKYIFDCIFVSEKSMIVLVLQDYYVSVFLVCKR